MYLVQWQGLTCCGFIEKQKRLLHPKQKWIHSIHIATIGNGTIFSTHSLIFYKFQSRKISEPFVILKNLYSRDYTDFEGSCRRKTFWYASCEDIFNNDSYKSAAK